MGRCLSLFLIFALVPFLLSCADADVPGGRNVRIPAPATAKERPESINEKPDSVLYLPLGSDVLVPETISANPLPNEIVGPFELRSETLAGALQLILADYEIPMAFETEEGLTRTITVTNLRGPLDRVVDRVCGLADLYCAFEDGMLVVKETQTFVVTVPPIGGEDNDILAALATGLEAITGASPITESGTRTVIYEATNRTAKLAERYFQRIRANTALIVFEMYIWEVDLNTTNSTGIDWQEIVKFGEFDTGFDISGSVADTLNPISIGLPTKGAVSFGPADVFQFISDYGAVKTISQPQITVLSGAEATLRVAATDNFVSSLSRSVDNGVPTVSTETDSVDTGFTITISSAWDNATIYGDIQIELQEFLDFAEFTTEGTTLKLPQTTERELSSQIRVRPGDSLLIAGLVRENDSLNKAGPGFNEPLFSTTRSAVTGTNELVFLIRPRVIVFTTDEGEEGVTPGPVAFSGGRSDAGAELEPEGDLPMGSIEMDLLNPSL